MITEGQVRGIAEYGLSRDSVYNQLLESQFIGSEVIYKGMSNPEIIKAITKQQISENSRPIDIGRRKQERLRSYLQKAAPGVCVRLAKCVRGEIELSPVQFNSAALILRKVLPDAVPDSNNIGQSLAQLLNDIARQLPAQSSLTISSANNVNDNNELAKVPGEDSTG